MKPVGGHGANHVRLSRDATGIHWINQSALLGLAIDCSTPTGTVDWFCGTIMCLPVTFDITA